MSMRCSAWCVTLVPRQTRAPACSRERVSNPVGLTSLSTHLLAGRCLVSEKRESDVSTAKAHGTAYKPHEAPDARRDVRNTLGPPCSSLGVSPTTGTSCERASETQREDKRPSSFLFCKDKCDRNVGPVWVLKQPA